MMYTRAWPAAKRPGGEWVAAQGMKPLAAEHYASVLSRTHWPIRHVADLPDGREVICETVKTDCMFASAFGYYIVEGEET